MAIFKKRGEYYIDYYAHGRRVREKVGPSLRLARLAEMKRKAELAEGKFFPARAKPAPTFAEAADLYWELHASKTAGAHATVYMLRALAAAFGKKRLDQLSVPDIHRWRNSVTERSTGAYANRLHVVLRAVINRAIEWGNFAGPNPAARVRALRVENARLRFLDRGEIARLLAACSPEIQPLVVTALLTGMRKGELLKLRWEHVDLATGTIYVLETKSGRPREIPVASKLADLLATIPHGDGGRVFAVSEATIKRHFARALSLAGIADLRFHDLRHTFASHYIMRTNDLPATQALLGHASPRMTQRYAHLSKGHLRAGIETFSAGMDTIWTPGPAPEPRGETQDGSPLWTPVEKLPAKMVDLRGIEPLTSTLRRRKKDFDGS